MEFCLLKFVLLHHSRSLLPKVDSHRGYQSGGTKVWGGTSVSCRPAHGMPFHEKWWEPVRAVLSKTDHSRSIPRKVVRAVLSKTGHSRPIPSKPAMRSGEGQKRWEHRGVVREPPQAVTCGTEERRDEACAAHWSQHRKTSKCATHNHTVTRLFLEPSSWPHQGLVGRTPNECCGVLLRVLQHTEHWLVGPTCVVSILWPLDPKLAELRYRVIPVHQP